MDEARAAKIIEHEDLEMLVRSRDGVDPTTYYYHHQQQRSRGRWRGGGLFGHAILAMNMSLLMGIIGTDISDTAHFGLRGVYKVCLGVIVTVDT